MERRFQIGIVLAFIIVAAIGFYISTPTKADVITIGHIGPLTGFMAAYGEQESQGIDLAIEEINANGGINGKKLAVIHEDDQIDPTKATNALNKLITIDKVPAVIGEVTAAVTLALAPIAETNKVVLITDISSHKISKSGDYIFQMPPTSDQVANELVDLASSLNLTDCAILYTYTEYCADLAQSINKTFTEKGYTITFSEGYNPDTTDFRTQLTKIKAKNPMGIFILGWPNDMALVLKQAKEIGIKSRFFAPDTFNEPKIIDWSGNASEGVIFVIPAGNPERLQGFNEKIKSNYGDNATMFAALAYDATNVLAAAMMSNGFKADEIKTGLYQIRDYPGVMGNVTFDENGDLVSGKLKPMIVRGGEFVDYEG